MLVRQARMMSVVAGGGEASISDTHKGGGLLRAAPSELLAGPGSGPQMRTLSSGARG
jgi:hypothetical protein